MKLRPFELALVIIFGGLALGALILLNVWEPDPEDEDVTEVVGTVAIWGTLPAEGVGSLLFELAEENKSFKNVSYRYFSTEEFDGKLITALADGEGPDLILISHEKLVEMRQRIKPFSPEAFPLRDFRDLYIDGAEIFYLNDGAYGYPIAVDPLMLYWNRDILATEGFLEAPRTWESLINDMFPRLIKRDFDRTINRSVVAMGEYGNIRNAFGIVSALLIQQGSRGVTENDKRDYVIQLNQAVAGGAPLTMTADFYTRFSKPSNSLYSWNRSFTEDRLQFIGEDLAFYFGYGSEGPELERLNPNLNFDIAEIPQGEKATLRRTFARFYALSILEGAKNPVGAAAAMRNLAVPAVADRIASLNGMVPVYRSSITKGSNDKFGRVTYMSASIAYGWLNPDLRVVNTHFETMMKDINENRGSIDSAAADLENRLKGEY